jgi:tetratricopeptide (TPR) repeat protein
MKFSDNKNYQEYMRHYPRGDYLSARLAIERCQTDLQAESDLPDPTQSSYLFKVIADLFFLEGNKAEAVRHYELSEKADPTSLIAIYYYAKFLAEKLREVGGAEKKCDRIIELANNPSFNFPENDLSRDEYIEMATQLKLLCDQKFP